MRYSKILLNITKISGSNLATIVASLASGFLLPKYMSIDDYAYYKVFSLYVAYAAILHFGFADGILLSFGGKKYEELNKEEMRCYSVSFILLELLVACVIIIVSAFALKSEYRFIGILIGIYTFSLNVTSYYRFISQATQRFDEMSIRNILQSVFKLAAVIIPILLLNLGVLNSFTYVIYISSLVGINVLLMIWYLYTYREITFGPRDSLNIHLVSFMEIFKLGILVTVAYEVSNLIFVADRQFVSLLFDTKIYASYSFAYSIIGLITTFIGAISTVMFPILKTLSDEALPRSYPMIMNLFTIFSMAALCVFYPLIIFVKWFLPDYISSIIFIKIVFPALAISSCITIIVSTYYKAIKKVNIYFKASVLALVLAILLNYLAYSCFKSAEAISVASVLTLILWYVTIGSHAAKLFGYNLGRQLIYMFVMISVFYVLVFSVSNYWLGLAINVVSYIVISLLFYHNELFNALQYIRTEKALH